MGIFARKDIMEDEELTFDYQFDSFKTPFTKCYCGASKCKGYLGLGVYEDAGDEVNAPECKICKNPVEEQAQLLVCKGECGGVYHLDCAALKDKSILQYSFNKRNYICKKCKKADKLRQKQLREAEE